jgi:hypothetical protein
VPVRFFVRKKSSKAEYQKLMRTILEEVVFALLTQVLVEGIKD